VPQSCAQAWNRQDNKETRKGEASPLTKN
jgi:hypothetical protein